MSRVKLQALPAGCGGVLAIRKLERGAKHLRKLIALVRLAQDADRGSHLQVLVAPYEPSSCDIVSDEIGQHARGLQSDTQRLLALRPRFVLNPTLDEARIFRDADRRHASWPKNPNQIQDDLGRREARHLVNSPRVRLSIVRGRQIGHQAVIVTWLPL